MVDEIAVHCVDVVFAEPETDLALLAIEQEEDQPNCAARKTRDALLRGQQRFANLANSIHERPKCYIPAAAFTLVAVSDPRDELEDGQCYVVVNGEAMIGEAAVWRMPCHSPTDVEVMNAVEPPGTRVLPDNALVLSRKGLVNSGLAGGDLDGDLNSVAFWPKLVDLVRKTAVHVKTLDMSALESEISNRLCRREALVDDGPEPEPARQAQNFVACSMKGAAVTVQGKVCAMSERAACKALKSKDPVKDGTLGAACRFAVVCHKAMDVPKHYTADA